MLADTVLHPDEPLSAITHIPLADPYGRQPGEPLFRSRMPKQDISQNESVPARAGKLIESSMITVRDYNILKTLLGVGILTRHQTQRLFWEPGASLSVINRRLKRLTDRGVLLSTITHRELLSDLGLERCNLFSLGDVGREIMAIREGRPSWRRIPYNTKYYDIRVNNRLIRHHLMTSEIYTRLKEKSGRVGNEMVWFNEMACIIREEKQELVRPDAYAAIWRNGFAEEAHLFIETDTRHTNWEKKVPSYKVASVRGDWREVLDTARFPLVLCVVPSEQAVSRVAGLIKARSTNVTYLLKAWPRFLVEDPYVGWYHAQGDAGEELVKILPDSMIQEDQ